MNARYPGKVIAMGHLGLPIGVWIGLAMLAGNAWAQFPDLTITEIDITPPNPAPGQTVNVTVTASNIGNAEPIDPVICYLYHNSPGVPVPCSFDQQQFLEVPFPSNTERLFHFTVQYPSLGQFRLWAWIDGCEPIVDEWDESNNNLSRDISVGIGDLTIDSIGTNTPDPAPGEMVYTRVVLRNTGPAIIDQIWRVGVVFQSAEPTTCIFTQNSDPFQGFAANSTVEVLLGPRVYEVAGTYPVWGWVDCLNDVVEADDGNNKLSGSIVIGRPDLIVDSVTPSVATPTVNVPFDVAVVIRNGGSRQADASEAALATDLVSAPGEPCLPGRVSVQALAPGASTTVTFPVTLGEARSYRLWGLADVCGVLDEAHEDNNARSLDVNVGDNRVVAPDLVVESIRVTEIPTQEWGAVTTFDVSVRNVGVLSAGACRVGDFDLEFPGQFPTFIVIGSPGPTNGGSGATAVVWTDCTWRTRELPVLLPGSSATVQFWRAYPGAGRYSFTASADVCGPQPNHNILESSETNNSLTVEFDVAACAADADGDGVCDADDFCPSTYDPLNYDRDNDGVGDACDDDDDNDGVNDIDDCEPLNRFIYPGAVENCSDGIDNNCDGQIDEGAAPLYRDADGDGFGDPSDVIRDCSRSGYVTNDADCDDTRAEVYPGANGRCDDGLDNDCDGVIDNERPIWGRDRDADGFTEPNDEIVDDDGVCDGQPAGYSLKSALPDPNDDDFMVPEPVRPEPASILFSVTRYVVPPAQALVFVRNGAESYSYEFTVEYQPDSNGFPPSDRWLSSDTVSGTAGEGRAEISLSAAAAPFLASYPATMHVSINGRTAFDVPVVREIRRPRLTIRHRGQGDGSLTAVPFSVGEPVFGFDTTQGATEAVLSFGDGESVDLLARTNGDCSNLVGLFDVDGNRLQITDDYLVDADGNVVEDGFGFPANPEMRGPGISRISVVNIQLNGDQEVTAQFALSGQACTTCAMILLTIGAIGLGLSCPAKAGRR